MLYVDQLVKPSSTLESEAASSSSSSNSALDEKEERNEDVSIEAGEDEPLIQIFECRICQEEDSVSSLEVPCGCSGSLKVFLESLLWFINNLIF